MIDDDDIKYIKDSILAEFGYDKELYLAEPINKSNYKPTYANRFKEFANELEIETFKRNMDDSSEAVLYSSNVYWKEPDKFIIQLNTGYPIKRYIKELSSNIHNYNELFGVGLHFKTPKYHEINLFDGYKELLRDIQIDKILT